MATCKLATEQDNYPSKTIDNTAVLQPGKHDQALAVSTVMKETRRVMVRRCQRHNIVLTEPHLGSRRVLEHSRQNTRPKHAFIPPTCKR
jgi:hypothetical protein